MVAHLTHHFSARVLLASCATHERSSHRPSTKLTTGAHSAGAGARHCASMPAVLHSAAAWPSRHTIYTHEEHHAIATGKNNGRSKKKHERELCQCCASASLLPRSPLEGGQAEITSVHSVVWSVGRSLQKSQSVLQYEYYSGTGTSCTRGRTMVLTSTIS
jgi:hypothetical protein